MSDHIIVADEVVINADLNPTPENVELRYKARCAEGDWLGQVFHYSPEGAITAGEMIHGRLQPR